MMGDRTLSERVLDLEFRLGELEFIVLRAPLSGVVRRRKVKRRRIPKVECPECGLKVLTAGGLLRHRSLKHVRAHGKGIEMGGGEVKEVSWLP